MKDIEIKQGDIIGINDFGIYVITQNGIRMTKGQFKQLLKDEVIYYDRTQWGVDHFLVYGEDKKKAESPYILKV